jgi:GTPase
LLPDDERKNLQDYAERTTREAAQALALDGLRHEARGGIIGVSALTGEGIPELLRLLETRLTAQSRVYDIDVPVADGAALSWLYAHGKIVDKKETKTKSRLRVELDPADFGRFESRFGKNAT